MRFRYYLRGAGVGIIVSTVILMIAFGQYKPTLSADEIKAEAEKLGMIMPEEVSKTEQPTDINAEDETNQEDATQEGDAQETITQPESNTNEESTIQDGGVTDQEQEEQTAIAIVIERGDVSRVVSTRLFEAGLIDDVDTFDKYFCQTGRDNYMYAGTYYIQPGATYDEIISMISGGN